MEESVTPEIWIGQHTIDTGSAYSGSYLSITDSLNPYGLGVEMSFPKEKQGVNTLVTIEGWVKSSKAFPNARFVVTVIDDGKELFWEGIGLYKILTVADEWCSFKSNFKIPASVTKGAIFKCFLWNVNQKYIVAIDNLHVNFEKAATTSFLPKTDKIDSQLKSLRGETEILFTNPFYTILLNEENGIIEFVSKNGEPVVGHFRTWDYLNVKGKKLEQSELFTFIGKKTKQGVTTLKLRAKSIFSTKTLQIQCNPLSPKLSCQVDEKYKKTLTCERSTIILQIEQPVTEVMRANRKSDKKDFQKEYWLDKQGAVFGKGGNSFYIYHTRGISSLQLDPENRILYMNLDYEKDHPFLHFPLNNDTIDYKVDWSESQYKKREKWRNNFDFYIGVKAASLPRFMKNPLGYLATYIWTEHADFTNINTNRATYYGSEKITNPDDATGGFVFYNIPVTKSVFYDNPDRITNAVISGGAFGGLESTIKTDTAFYSFLKQIQNYETEICLHTPEQFTTTSKQLEAALKFTNRDFNAVSWIDHGYNNHERNNREDIMCDGLIRKSPFYSAKLWNKYDVTYFWNAYYEDYFSFENWRFGSSLESYFSGYGDFMPKPDYWYHPTRSGEFIHWPTSTVLYVENDALWDYFFNDQNLMAFIDNWSVEMNHCYPAWVDPKKGFWTYGADSTIVAQPGFNRTLEKMSKWKDDHLLNVTTVKEFIDYQLLIENIEFQLLPDGRIKVINNNVKDIIGLSFATKAKMVLVDRLKPAQKASGNDLVFWFDIKAGASKLIRIIE